MLFTDHKKDKNKKKPSLIHVTTQTPKPLTTESTTSGYKAHEHLTTKTHLELTSAIPSSNSIPISSQGRSIGETTAHSVQETGHTNNVEVEPKPTSANPIEHPMSTENTYVAVTVVPSLTTTDSASSPRKITDTHSETDQNTHKDPTESPSIIDNRIHVESITNPNLESGKEISGELVTEHIDVILPTRHGKLSRKQLFVGCHNTSFPCLNVKNILLTV